MLGALVVAFFRGVLDSLRGFPAIFYLDRPPSGSTSSSFVAKQQNGPSSQPPLTTLAQRRREIQARQQAAGGQLAVDSKPEQRPKAWKRLLSCVTLNLLCIVVLHFCLVPLIHGAVRLVFGEHKFSVVASVLSAFWILPVFLITRLVNALWFQDIANAAVRYHGSRLAQQQRQSFSRSVADFVMAILLETVFLLQGYVVGMLPLPIVNCLFSFVHVCLLYSLYAFEYLWMSENVELRYRLRRIENNWSYFCGFGFLLTAVTLYPSSVVVSGCISGVFFPLLIISSFESATPLIDGDSQRINFFDPSLYVCEKVSMNLINRATARTFVKRR